ncbi:aldo/keto reductase [Actinomycetota bacterium]|nr:aldo/keto reductase [Actinomycetota bacterium]
MTRKLGKWDVKELGLGAMPLSIEDRPEREDAIALLHHALDLGINHIDTAYAYYLAGGTLENGEEGHNEKLIAEALRTYSGDTTNVTVASKVGHFRYLDQNNQPMWGQQGCARYILETAQQSRDNLETDSIDLYYYHRPDLNVRYEESIGALEKLLEDGVIKYAGISNASVEQIKYTQSVLGDKFIAVQNQFSPGHISTLDTLEYTNEAGLTFLPWSPLGGFRNPELQSKDQPFEEVGEKYGVSKQQVILAWELAKGEHVVPIPGFRRNLTLEDSLKAIELKLSEEDLQKLG